MCVFAAQFGCLSWSRCEKKLLYVAERSREAPTDDPAEGAASAKVHTSVVSAVSFSLQFTLKHMKK